MKRYFLMISMTLILLCFCTSCYREGSSYEGKNAVTTSGSEVSTAIPPEENKLPENALEVYSIYSSKNYLLPAKFDQEYYYRAAEYGMYTYTTLVNGKLCVTDYPTKPVTQKIEQIAVSGGRFIGTASHNDGVILFQDLTKEELVQKTVAREMLCEFIRVDTKTVYIITSGTDVPGASDSDGWKIYEAKLATQPDTWTWRIAKVLPESPMRAILSSDGSTIYIASHTQISAYNIETCSLKTYTMPKYYHGVSKMSLTELDGKLYIGTNCGIVEFDLATRKTLWYPIDFDEFLGK